VGWRDLSALGRQLDALPAFDAAEVHLGGGTPTWLDEAQLVHLRQRLHERFGDLVWSVECDPMTLTSSKLVALGAGLSRVSLGVQSLDPVVTEAVGRDQTASRVDAAIAMVRAAGVPSINIDLMYGLPSQTLPRFARTLEQVVDWRPQRIAVFGYAHVPRMLRHQATLTDLPSPAERLELALLAAERLTDAGYRRVGFDHYALPDDPLVTGPVERGFMGYTPRALPIVGLGPSAISTVDGTFLQVEPHLGRWLRDGMHRVHRFHRSTQEERRAAAVIEQLLCQGRARVHWDSFPDARRRLEEELSDVVDLGEAHVALRPGFELLARNVASAFDATGGRTGSRAI
jgi:oxygen-independent coproporphyrinogen-3 oxidase